MKLIKSLLRSFWRAFHSNEEIAKIKKHHPKITGIIKKRTNIEHFSGLPLTLLLVAIFYVLLLLGGVIEDFISSGIIVSADERINVLFYIFRNEKAVNFFLWITLLGKSYIVILFSVITTLILWLNKKKVEIMALWLTLVGSVFFTYVTKILLNRPRPQLAVYLEHSGSFPSGHATITMAFYGFLIYLAWKFIKKRHHLVLANVGLIILIFLIGFSRLYLGVHYISDVWAGYLVGLLWLIMSISLTEWKISLNKDNNKPILKNKTRKILESGLIITGLAIYLIFGILYHPELIKYNPKENFITVSNSQTIFQDYTLPCYTETLTGRNQEPISIIIIAPNDEILQSTLAKAGWAMGEKLNPSSVNKLIRSAVLNQAYPTAPMTPSFWNKQVHDFGWEKSTDTDSVRQRHHTRFWKTNYITENGDNVYFGTASLDTRIKWLITHQISPDIDSERDLILSDLQKTGLVQNFGQIKQVDPILGQNFSGDQFFTDGKAYLINL